MTIHDNPYLATEEHWDGRDRPFASPGYSDIETRLRTGRRVASPATVRSARHSSEAILARIDSVADAAILFTARHEPAQAVQANTDEPLRQQFDELASQWRRETRTLSSMDARVMHGAYQRIIGLGPSVVPLILDDLRTGVGGHWSWALMALTGENPAEGSTTPTEAAEAWVEWGKSSAHAAAR